MSATVSFAPPQKAKALERTLEKLRTKVIAGDLMPGEQIRQQEMAEELGISRVPLREALNVLADQGLLIHRPNSGYFVAKRAQSELAQISRMLELLENELIASIDWPDDEHIARMATLNASMRVVATTEDWTPMIRLNREFHHLMFGLSPLRLIFEEVMRLWPLADTFISSKMASQDARLRTVDEHDRIIESLRRRDHAHCLAVMETHRASTAAGLGPTVPPPA
ncbi:GntR family transcriptional regulator [Hydrogenophaga sp. OTU3427]|uniref:GntR family transcriptional regulator n=1 Tax=Hydrogenophaga sp. OTU3427 TaxID=3043856 RepID=UPI00313EECBC